MKKFLKFNLIASLLMASFSSIASADYYLPYEGTKKITQGWNGTFSHGGSPVTHGVLLPVAIDVGGVFEVLAIRDGVVTAIGNDRYYGNYIIIDHQDRSGFQYAQYAHFANQKINVKIGDRVKRGQVLGVSGNTGNSTGPHLHLQICNTKTRIAVNRNQCIVVDFDGVNRNRINGDNSVRVTSTNRKVNSHQVSQKSKLDTPNVRVNAEGSQVSAEWRSIRNAQVYRVIVSRDRNFSGFNERNNTCNNTCYTTTVNKPSYTNNHASGSTYFVRVRAGASNAPHSDWSKVEQVRTN